MSINEIIHPHRECSFSKLSEFFSTLCFSTKSSIVPSSYLSTVVTSLIINSSSHHERMVSFFSTTFLQDEDEPTLLEKLLLFRKGEFSVLFILNLST